MKHYTLLYYTNWNAIVCGVSFKTKHKVFGRVLNVYNSGNDPLHVLQCSKLEVHKV